MAINEQELIERFRRGVQNGAANYTQGVTGSGSKWKTAAAGDAAESRYAAGVARAAQQKSRQKAVAAVSADKWETAARDVGSANYSRSAQRAGDNYAQVAGNVIAAANKATSAANALPGDTMEQRLQRGPAAAREIHRHWAQVKGLTPEV